jgi:type I restriction enzyme R subunit
MLRIGGEGQAVQSPLIRYVTEAGWTHLSRDDALRLRVGETGPVLRDVFIQQVQKLNPGTVDLIEAEEQVKRLLRLPPTIEGNQQVWEFLKGLKTVFVPAERRERDLTLIDFDHPDRNTFHVTSEYQFSNGTYSIRPDVVFLVNGIPIILIEAKSPKHARGAAEALDQVRRYHREGPELLYLTQLFGLTHLIHFYYGATWNLAQKNLFNWRDESVSQDFETLVKTFVSPQRVLKVLSDFILFTRRDDELIKVVLHPHQMRAVDRALYRSRDPHRRRGLIWHTQGSGKTFTMITIARKLIEEPAFQNPTVLMLVDRTELEAQLFGNLAACGISHVEVAQNKRHLQQILASDYRGLVVSMVHKFEDIPENVNIRENVFVLVDEAHRSTGGDLGNFLMAALPNATYLGFTGTPIDKTAYGRGTFKVFGSDDPETGYLDKYSISESIEDGTTVPLYYTLAPNDLRVDRETLDREFLDLKEAEGVSDQEDLDRVLARAVNLRNMLKNRERVQKVAQYVARDFIEKVEPMGYKAFLVAVDREACTFYKEALDQYLPKEYSQVVISPAHNDPAAMAGHHLSEQREKEIRKDFVSPDELPKILIVTEKLLTGYDAPVLYCMYLDKPMRDHVLLQAIARVNRPYEDEDGKHKPGGFVLDFVGIFENLEKALAFDSRDVQSVVEGLDVLKERFSQLMLRAREYYLPLVKGASPDKAAESVLEHFRDQEPREQLYRFFRELQDLYEMISPDVFLREFMADYHRVADMYATLRSAYESGPFVDQELARKTARLVQEQTQAGVIRESVKVYEINVQTLDQIAQSNQSSTVKVFNLIKSIEKKVQEEIARAPYLLSIGERAEQIAEAFRLRQLSTQEALNELEELITEINQAQQEQADRNISAEPFAAYWILKKAGAANVEQVPDRVSEVLDRYPYWHTSQDQARQLRRSLYRLLGEAGVKDIPAMAEQIMSVLMKGRS